MIAVLLLASSHGQHQPLMRFNSKGEAIVAMLMLGLMIPAVLSATLGWIISKKTTQQKCVAVLAAVASIVLLVGATVTAQTMCGACMGCDPWWLEWFWMCVPAA